jgi:hypothetical protein
MIKMDHFNFSSKFKSIHQDVSPFLLCTITFRGPTQGSQSGLAFAKAGTGIQSVYIQLSYRHTTQKRLSSDDGKNDPGPVPGAPLCCIYFVFLGIIMIRSCTN